MTDLSILDLSLARMREVGIDPTVLPALIAAEKAGKRRKSVIAFLRSLLPPAFLAIECTAPNVHLGDGRQLGRGDRAWVARDVAELIVARGFAVHVG